MTTTTNETTYDRFTIGQEVTLRNPRRSKPQYVLNRHLSDGMAVTVSSPRPDDDGEVSILYTQEDGERRSAFVDAACLAPLQADENVSAAPPPLPLEQEVTCLTANITPEMAGAFQVVAGSLITYFPTMPWWSVAPSGLGYSRVLVLVNSEGPRDSNTWYPQPTAVENLLDGVIDDVPVGLRGRVGTWVPMTAVKRWLQSNTSSENFLPRVSHWGLDWLPQLSPIGRVFEPRQEGLDLPGGKSVVVSPDPMTLETSRVDGYYIRQHRLDGRMLGWYWAAVPTVLLSHATEREEQRPEVLLAAIEESRRDEERRRERLEEAVTDAAVEAVRDNGSGYRDGTVEMLEALGLDSSRVTVRTRRNVTTRVTIEVEITGYVDDEDQEVDDYEIQRALNVSNDGDLICVSIGDDFFDGDLDLTVVTEDVHSTTYEEEELDD